MHLILLNTGKVVSCGDNVLGQLGDNSTTSTTSLVSVSSGGDYDQSNAISVATGENQSYILLNTGKVVAFGQKVRLGINISEFTNQLTPTGLYEANGYTSDNVISVSSGEYVGAIVLNTGKILTFGFIKDYLAVGSETHTYAPMSPIIGSDYPTIGSDYDGTNVGFANYFSEIKGKVSLTDARLYGCNNKGLFGGYAGLSSNYRTITTDGWYRILKSAGNSRRVFFRCTIVEINSVKHSANNFFIFSSLWQNSFIYSS